MKITRMKKYSLISVVIVILFTCIPSASAQSQDVHQPQGFFFNLQFVLTISWGNETSTPISPGETRDVNLTITYTVTRGVYGRLLLKLLEGKSFPIQLSIEDKPDWCEAWVAPPNMTGVIPDEVGYLYPSLFIHLYDDAPSNYTLGWVKMHCVADDMKGPFNIITLIQSYEQQFTISFVTGP
jgi:hypothetical protein